MRVFFSKVAIAIIMAFATITTTAPASAATIAQVRAWSVTVTATTPAKARARAWSVVKRSKYFMQWDQGIRFEVLGATRDRKIIKIKFTGGNGKEWYVLLTATSVGGSKYSVKWCASPTPNKDGCWK